MLPDFPIRNQSLLDLLGVAFVLQPATWNPQPFGEKTLSDSPNWNLIATDAQGASYDIGAGGMQALPTYQLFRNRQVLPRAFVVHRSASLPAGQVLPALQGCDFRTTVLLEEAAPISAVSANAETERRVAISKYEPNRVEIDVADGHSGFLVLADIWYPGWACAIDGRPAPVHRADFLFRAVEMPAGRHAVAFTFAPGSYRIGKLVSLATLVILSVGLAGAWRYRGKQPNHPAPSPGLLTPVS
jgi:hypothetical protein